MQVLKYSNMALFISFLLQAATSLVMFFGLNLPSWFPLYNIHAYNGLLMIVLVFFHVYLHWPAVRGLFFRKK